MRKPVLRDFGVSGNPKSNIKHQKSFPGASVFRESPSVDAKRELGILNYGFWMEEMKV
jgi:hypothetical protein